MTILEKIQKIKEAQDYTEDVEKKLKEIIKAVFDPYCCFVEEFSVLDKKIVVGYVYNSQIETDADTVIIPIEWLADDFDYVAAFKKQQQKDAEDKARREAFKQAKLEQEKLKLKETEERHRKEEAERALYIKLKEKFDIDE